MRSTNAVAPELYWFLGALGVHLLGCITLFSAVWLAAPGSVLEGAAGTAFDIVARPGPLPVSSFVWGVVIAAAARVWRRLRGAA